MKIRTYLAILVLIALVGGNGVRYLLSKNYSQVSEQSHEHAQVLLWQKDFQRTTSAISQYLISSDLVVGSGETYLANGALKKGKIIIGDLKSLADSNVLLTFKSVSDLIDLATYIADINRLIEQVSLNGLDELSSESGLILGMFDQTASSIDEDLERLDATLNNLIEENSTRLDIVESGVNTYSLKIQILFSLLVVLSWYWASRTICRPLQQLRNEARAAQSGTLFIGVNSGPEEIKQLSDNFATLTKTLSFQATHDPLTQLYNRRAFDREMAAFLDQAKEQNVTHSLCFIDLDHFKAINDTCGHAAGDEILVEVSNILKQNVSSSDIVARLGGDEFAILLSECSVEKGIEVANTIRNAIRSFEYLNAGQVFRIGASIGITEIDANAYVIEDMLNAADIACMQAKESGRDVVIMLDSCTNLLEQNRLDATSINQIKSALQDNRFELYRQNITSLKSTAKEGKHYEILLRMRDEKDEIVGPAVFMPLVERYRLGTEIDRWVINATIDWLAEHPRELADLEMCSINLSGQSVGHPDTGKFIADKLADKAVTGTKLCFEITETAAITDLECANELISGLKRHGCRFALDDFGSGLSSFAYLKNLQVDYVKIDGVFVKDIVENELDHATVKAITDVAKANGKETIAEFVENGEIAKVLRELGIDFAQGYYFDKPGPLNSTSNIVCSDTPIARSG